MSATHAIRDFTFDISFSTEAAAFAQQTQLQSFVSGRMLSIIEEVLSEFDPGDESILRIKELEVDLGRIAENSYYEQAEDIFRKRLVEQLHDHFGQLGASLKGVQNAVQRSNFNGVVSHRKSEIDTIMWVLEHGHLPWNVRDLSSSELHSMLDRVLRSEGAEFTERLRNIPHVSQVARRLAWQMPEDLLTKILWPFYPVPPPPGRRDEWETALLKVLGHTREPQLWLKNVEQAVARGDSTLFGAHWNRLFVSHARLVESVVRDLGIRRDVRHAMAKGLPDEILGNILQLLEPQESEFISQVTTRPEIFREAAKEHGRSRAETRIQLWEFTLTYLLVDSGGQFNRRSYIENTMRQMAAHINTTYREILSALIQIVGQVEAGNSLKTGMLAVLIELSEPMKSTERSPNLGEDTLRGEGKIQRYQYDFPAAKPDQHYFERNEPRSIQNVGPHDEDVHRAEQNTASSGQEVRRPEVVAPYLVENIEHALLARQNNVDGVSSRNQQPSAPPVKISTWTATFAEALQRLDTTQPLPPTSAWNSLLNARDRWGSRRIEAENKKQEHLERATLASLATLVFQAERHYRLTPSGPSLSAIAPGRATPFATPPRHSLLLSVIDTLRALPLSASAAHELTTAISDVLWSWPRAVESLRMQGDTRASLSLFDVLIAGQAIGEQQIHPVSRQHLSEKKSSPARGPQLLTSAPSRRSILSVSKEFAEQLESRLSIRDLTKGFVQSLQRSVKDGNLLHTGSDQSTPRSVLQAEWTDLIREVAETQALSPATLLRELSAEFEHLEINDKWVGEVISLLRDLRLPWSRALEQALLTGDVRLLRLLLADNRLRSIMIEQMPPALLCDIAELVEPASAPLMHTLTEQSEVFYEALPQENPSAIRRSLWEFTFAYAVVDRGSAFNARSYAVNVIGQLAARHNLPYRDLAASLCSLIETAGLPDHLYAELASILRPLNPQPADAQPNQKPPHSTKAESNLAEQELRVISKLLAEAARNPSPQLIQSIELYLDTWMRASPPSPSMLDRARGHQRAIRAIALRAQLVRSILIALEKLSQPSPVYALDATAALGHQSAQQPDWLRRLLLKRLTEPGFLQRVVTRLPQNDLNQFFHQLAPSGMVSLASLASELTRSLPNVKLEHKWKFLFLMAGRGGRVVSDKAFVRQYVCWLAGRMGWKNVETIVAGATSKLRSHARSAPNSGRSRTADLLELAFKTSSAHTPVEQIKAGKQAPRPVDLAQHPIFIRNAGQILAGPYLPRLFDMTGLLQYGKFRDEECATRGIYLLQYMVDGSLNAPEHKLTLNKILCGLQPADPIRYTIALTATEKEVVEGLLKAIISNWPAVGNTSVRGLQESFLQREGRLTALRDSLQLLVEPRAFDMLLDRIPWAYNIIKFPWMNAALYVEWR